MSLRTLTWTLILTFPSDLPVPLWPEGALWPGSHVWMTPAALLSPVVEGWLCQNSGLSKSVQRNSQWETGWTDLYNNSVLTTLYVFDSRELTCWEPLLLVTVPRIRGGGAEELDRLEGCEIHKDIKQQTGCLKWNTAVKLCDSTPCLRLPSAHCPSVSGFDGVSSAAPTWLPLVSVLLSVA